MISLEAEGTHQSTSFCNYTGNNDADDCFLVTGSSEPKTDSKKKKKKDPLGGSSTHSKSKKKSTTKDPLSSKSSHTTTRKAAKKIDLLGSQSTHVTTTSSSPSPQAASRGLDEDKLLSKSMHGGRSKSKDPLSSKSSHIKRPKSINKDCLSSQSCHVGTKRSQKKDDPLSSKSSHGKKNSSSSKNKIKSKSKSKTMEMQRECSPEKEKVISYRQLPAYVPKEGELSDDQLLECFLMDTLEEGGEEEEEQKDLANNVPFSPPRKINGYVEDSIMDTSVSNGAEVVGMAYTATLNGCDDDESDLEDDDSFGCDEDDADFSTFPMQSGNYNQKFHVNHDVNKCSTSFDKAETNLNQSLEAVVGKKDTESVEDVSKSKSTKTKSKDELSKSKHGKVKAKDELLPKSKDGKTKINKDEVSKSKNGKTKDKDDLSKSKHGKKKEKSELSKSTHGKKDANDDLSKSKHGRKSSLSKSTHGKKKDDLSKSRHGNKKTEDVTKVDAKNLVKPQAIDDDYDDESSTSSSSTSSLRKSSQSKSRHGKKKDELSKSRHDKKEKEDVTKVDAKNIIKPQVSDDDSSTSSSSTSSSKSSKKATERRGGGKIRFKNSIHIQRPQLVRSVSVRTPMQPWELRQMLNINVPTVKPDISDSIYFRDDASIVDIGNLHKRAVLQSKLGGGDPLSSSTTHERLRPPVPIESKDFSLLRRTNSDDKLANYLQQKQYL
ncbi:hypothetical protein IV203_028224 [Nitzschia inconspicua]|uniref:Uncharacterized protein n=1 Tax=Nitzschia inconspicua TaxID=303405 RepID=A0A9K3P9U4_9STRA|nr:hypothetical protein IV203_028224 [Nitzschia inconspicua]